MPRPPSATLEKIRTAVRAMLAEAGEPTPASGQRFRAIVSVRKLRERLGAGDPGTLARALNTIEAEVVGSGMEAIEIPGMPPEIAEQMTALWQAAVTVQIEAVAQRSREVEQRLAEDKQAREDAQMRVEWLSEEVGTLRQTLNTRDSELADLRVQNAALTRRNTELEAAAQTHQQQLEGAAAERAALERAHADALEAARARYDGLSKQLLQETERQRALAQREVERTTERLTAATARLARLETDLAQQGRELTQERSERQRAESAMDTLNAVNVSQTEQIDTLKRAASTAEAWYRSATALPRSPGARRLKPLQKNRAMRRATTP